MLNFKQIGFCTLTGISIGIISTLLLQQKKKKSTSYNEVHWQVKKISSLSIIAYELNEKLSELEMKYYRQKFDHLQLNERVRKIKDIEEQVKKIMDKTNVHNKDAVLQSLSKLVFKFNEQATLLEKSVFGRKPYQKINNPMLRIFLIYQTFVKSTVGPGPK